MSTARERRIKNNYLRAVWIIIASVAIALLALFFDSIYGKSIENITIPAFLLSSSAAIISFVFIPCYKIVNKYGAYQPYYCGCGTGDKVTLGFRLVLGINIFAVPAIFVLPPILTVFSIMEGGYLQAFIWLALPIIYLLTIYKDVRLMRSHGHTKTCSIRCALMAMFFTARAGGLHIVKPRKGPVQTRKQPAPLEVLHL